MHTATQKGSCAILRGMQDSGHRIKTYTHLLVPALAGGLVVCVVLIIVQAWVHAEYRERCNPLDGCGPVTPPLTLRQSTANTDTTPTTHTVATTSSLASTSTPAEAIDPETTNTTSTKPILTSISPTQGPHGTIITLTGSNLAGFEGDLDAWIKDERGTTAHLPQFFGQPAPDTDAGIDTILVKLPERACTTNNTYSGNACEKHLELIPGEYRLYAWPFGEPSNELAFTITNSTACADLGEALCFQAAGCKAVYGPSSCLGNECTDDEAYAGCNELSQADETRAAEPLAAMRNPYADREYVRMQSWPPLVYDGFVSVPPCPSGETTMLGHSTETMVVRVSDATYCRTTYEEAGTDNTTERTYLYTTEEALGTRKLWFTLTFANCDTLANTSQVVACRAQQATLDLDQTIDTLIRASLIRE